MRTLLAALIVSFGTAAVAAPCAELPVLFIVQDKSGSMAKAPDGSNATTANPSKWSIAQQVVPALASTFSNRFRFGAAMYPRDTTTFNCSTGTVVTPISSTSSGIDSAYTTAVPGGGTPTAASLSAVRSYLAGQALSTPAYVLLITDGLPNCNTALDANSCAPTTPGCGPTPNASTCGLGAKDCLDSQSTVTAAQQLFAAGVKVFVVGFDSTLTAGNNKAVLDAIASAGGTGSAYVASNQSQLSQTLNTIAANTATCCRDVCTAGAQACTPSGQRQTCQLDASLGCTTWTTQPCTAGTTCSNGTCASCNTCTAGALRCNANGDAEQCVPNAQGCTAWVVAETCAYGEVCSGGMCNTCQACSIGASRCTANGVESCDWDVVSGCTRWSTRACAAGSTCQNGACEACNTTCTAGAKRCTGKTVETCVANAQGCTSWQAGQVCNDFCSGGACGTCGTSCTAGQTRCQGTGGVETCLIDQNSCPAWGPVQQCPPNNVCAGGLCQECPSACTAGAKRCTATGAVESCELQPSGCSAFVPTAQCDLSAGERCENGVCIPPCQNACNDGARQCSNGTPQVCAPGPTGCTVWRDDTACSAMQQCVEGTCRELCGADEFESCPEGQICTGVTEGRFCFPDQTDAGTGGSGGGTGAVDAGPSTGMEQEPQGSGRIGATAMGCQCNSIDGALPLLGLAVLALRRRRA